MLSGYWECKDPKLATKEMCVCPKDYYGSICQYRSQYGCHLSVTSPPLNEECDEQSSFAFDFSIPGWSPCIKVKGSEKLTIKGTLECTNLKKIGRPDYNLIEVEKKPEFKYDIDNEALDLTILKYKPINATLMFYNWKWISQTIDFQSNEPISAEHL
jgi:hypothetical protein